ncbi:hypothetical protein EV06_2020 [Prochlorococcus sp. MIT 0602]|nr:hypothetical protein EV06_2020 [Prochlorococcus sp. MIT 0602]KGG15614.1 hypothetical protein EV07_1579 [Prochlorococcus sp. MIT 0603]
MFDHNSGDIIGTEIDENGNLRDCTRGNSSKKRGLPSCNSIIDKRELARSNSLKDSNKQSEKLLTDKVAGVNLFNLPNGSQIRVKSMVKYNDNTGQLIINSQVERVKGNSALFENLFIESKANIIISFLDKDDFELLEPLRLPLNVLKGQAQNISYRKKIGRTTDDIIAVRLQARRTIKSIREYKNIARIESSINF